MKCKSKVIKKNYLNLLEGNIDDLIRQILIREI